MDIVLDASIAIKWFSARNEDFVENALAIQEKQISGEIRIIVPDLFFLEVLNAFITKSKFDIEDISTIRDVLFKLGLEIKYPDDFLLSDSSKIAYSGGLTIYDSLYIAVAKSCNATLYTEDKKILSCRKKYPFITDIRDFA
ncbi:MAG: type II toxin-antitoxin system VapC family toxin [Actinobacteria bacterium]|nr:type II toxin-antitoxin system VapC family toxin [Actinomycetota bacterium]MBM3712704.1 type II toxin-antitoxin system VapC family toxin [Actinomycetota bacterium]